MSHLHFISRGSGYPVILLHGIAASQHDWDSLLPVLSSSDCRALAPDLTGHGDSEKPEEPSAYHAAEIYDHFESWLHQREHPPYILVGHSFGAYLSLSFYLHCKREVDALVLIAPFLNSHQLRPLLQAVHRKPSLGTKLMPLIPLSLIEWIVGWDPKNAQASPQARWQMAVDYKRASPNILNIPQSITDLTPFLSGVAIPTLVIWGEKDLTLDPASFPQLTSQIPGSQGFSIPEAGHQPHIFNPEIVNPLILNFILQNRSKTFPSQMDAESN